MTPNSVLKVINNLFTNKRLGFFLLGVGLYIIIRFPVWFYPVDSDHWIFQAIGQHWINGKGLLYVDFWDHKPPGIFLINGIISVFTGSDLFLFRAALTVLNIAEIYLFYVLLRKLKRFGEYPLVLTAVYALVRNFSQIASSGNNTENFGVILILISYIQFINFLEQPKARFLLLIGICFGLIFWLKANMILLFLPMLCLIIWRLFVIYKASKSLGESLKLFTILFAPLILISLVIIGYFGKFGYLQELWIGSFGYSAKYVQVSFRGALSGTKVFLAILSPLLAILIMPIFGWYQKIKAKQLTPLEIFIVVSSLVSMVYLGISGTYYPYYLLICLPILLIWVAIGHMNLSGLLKKLSTAVICLGLLISFGISYKQPLNYFTGSVSSQQAEYYQIAEYIKSKTNKDDRIFTYIYGASLYGLSERLPATKYMSASFMLLDYREKLGFGINTTVLSDLKRTQPKLIVMFKDKNPKTSLYATNYPIQEFLLSDYNTIEKEFETLEIRTRTVR